jgi:hypothetical protein
LEKAESPLIRKPKEIGAVVFTTAPHPKAPELPVVRPAIP